MHDLGGAHGFGPVAHTPEEPPFEHEWQRLVFGIESACLQGGVLNLHEIRYATELMDPVAYLTSNYYEHWLAGVEAPLVEKGLFDWEEIDRRTDHFLAKPDRGTLDPQREQTPPARTGEAGAPDASKERLTAPRFRVGDSVVTRKDHPRGHTRLPRYARGRVGIIERVGDPFELPDVVAHGLGARIERTYQVRFEGTELWGDAAEPGTAVCLDVWDSYIEPAEREAAPR